MHPARTLVALLFALACAGCTPEVMKISSRNPDLFEKESDHMEGRARGNLDAPAPEMFVRQKTTVIKDATRPNDTGSLFNPDDERNYLFTQAGPLSVGRFLRIKIVPNRERDGRRKDEGDKAKSGKDAKDAKDAGAPKDTAAKDAKGQPGKNGKGGEPPKPDEVVQELLKSVPELTPAIKDDPALLKTFKMQIMHRYENGDVLAMTDRRSTDGDQASQIVVQARIPYDRLTSGDELTTDDLLDVRFAESRGGELAERTSSGWEDEYSLRLSGFKEAKSKEAQELGEQKQKLAEAAGKLEERIKTFGDERRTVAKEREELIKAKEDQDEKVSGLEDKVKDQQSTIEKQQEEIQSLSPENKPSDGKEGGGG